MAMETTRGSFEAARSMGWRGEQLYRLLATDERLACLRTGGMVSASGGSVWAHFGLLGALIGYFVEKRAAKKRAAELPTLEQTPIDELLARDAKNNFELRLAAIDRAALGKPGFFKGAYAAKLVLGVGAVEHLFFIKSRPDAQRCRALLEGKLSAPLAVDPGLKWLGPIG